MHHQSVPQRCRHFEVHLPISSARTSLARYCNRWGVVAHSLQRLPRRLLGVLKKDFTTRGARWPCQAILPAWCLFFFTAKSFPPPEHVVFIFRFFSTKHVAVKLSVLSPDETAQQLTRVVCLLWQYVGAVQRRDGGCLVNACCGFDALHAATSGSCFLPFCKTQPLPDFMKPPAFQSIQQS